VRCRRASVWALSFGLACGEVGLTDGALLVALPSNLAESLPQPEHNPMTEAGVRLGERLFFDPQLSGSDEIACATCHRPELAFGDDVPRSRGAADEPLARHTPVLVNLAWASGTFWDGGAKNLESQVFAPLSSPMEMDQDLDELLEELRSDADYPAMFRRAFDDGITLANVARAIAQFERTLISGDSRYDRFVRDEPGGDLDAREVAGLEAFERHCASCHVPDFFTDYGYHNNGLDEHFPEDDERIAWGRGRITHAAEDIGRFKTPTLRNVSVSAPYMHDGRFATLEEVLTHYRHGVRSSPTLAPQLVGPDGGLGIEMSDEDAAAIIAFLGALTDLPLAELRGAARE
jgi:cytochrome c peroxidase